MKSLNREEQLKLLMSTKIFRGFSVEEGRDSFDELSPKLKTFPRDRIIAHQGDELDGIMVVASGSVREEKYFAEGELHIHDIYLPGEMPGLLAAVSEKRILHMTYTADTETQVLFIPLSRLYNLKDARRIRENLIYLLADESIMRVNKSEVLSNRGVRERIMAYLSVLRGKADSNEVTVNMSQEKLANYLCVNRSALSHELSRMRSEGLIDFKGRHYTIKY